MFSILQNLQLKKNTHKTRLSPHSPSAPAHLFSNKEKSLKSMKYLLKCRQRCLCHCSVYVWESNSERKSRCKRRRVSLSPSLPHVQRVTAFTPLELGYTTRSQPPVRTPVSQVGQSLAQSGASGATGASPSNSAQTAVTTEAP